MTPLSARLAANRYAVDAASHITLDQALARAAGTGRRLVLVCPAGVFTEDADGTIAVAHEGCLECGACLAVADPGTLTWHYPVGGRGVRYRQG